MNRKTDPFYSHPKIPDVCRFTQDEEAALQAMWSDSTWPPNWPLSEADLNAMEAEFYAEARIHRPFRRNFHDL